MTFIFLVPNPKKKTVLVLVKKNIYFLFSTQHFACVFSCCLNVFAIQDSKFSIKNTFNHSECNSSLMANPLPTI